jgi:hypothetical protein
VPSPRRPLRRPRRVTEFSHEVLQAFVHLKDLGPCTCEPLDSRDKSPLDLCHRYNSWGRWDQAIWEELNLKPWEIPAVAHPDTPNANPEARRRWLELEYALADAEEREAAEP